MKTTEKTNKKENGNVKSDVLSGASAGVGATIGMVVGSALVTEASAAEVEPPVVPPVKPEKPEEPVKPEEPAKPEEQVVITTEEPEIIVEDCGYVVFDDGSMAEVATLSIDGHAAIVVDADMDGMADLMAVDINNNNIVDENEQFDVSEDGLAMEAFREPDYTNIAQADNDYVNNADVQDYMA